VLDELRDGGLVARDAVHALERGGGRRLLKWKKKNVLYAI